MRLSFENYARNAYESQRPDLWPAHAWIPALGIQGATIWDVVGHQNAAFNVYPSSAFAWISGTAIQYTQLGSYKRVISLGACSLRNTTMLVDAMFLDLGGDRGVIGTRSTSYALQIFARIDNGSPKLFISVYNRSYRVAQDTVALVVGQRYSIGCRINAASTDLFLDGRLAATIAYVPMATSAELFLCETGEKDFVSGIYYTAQQHTLLTDAQIRDLSADPLLPLRRRAVQPYWVLDGVPSSVFRPFESSVFTSMRLRSSSIG